MIPRDALPPPPNLEKISDQTGTVAHTWADWFFRLRQALITAGTGSVSSVSISAPAEFTVSGSPITGSGTLTLTKATQAANTVYAGPASGVPAQPTFRALVAADVAALGGQAGIQYDDEGANLGAVGTVTEVDFVGAGVTAARVANKVTVTIAGSSSNVSDLQAFAAAHG